MSIQALDSAEIHSLLTCARAHSERDYLMFLTALCHGLRASEVVQIKRCDVADGYLTVRRLKGSLKTHQPLFSGPPEILNERRALSDYCLNLLDSERLFPITRQHLWRLFHRYAIEAGIPEHKAHTHTLKHTCAMQLLADKEDVDIADVQQYLGHKSLSSTGAYLKKTDEDAARAAHGAFSRLNI